MPSPGSRTSVEALLLGDDLARCLELAVPEVVQQRADAPRERLLGGPVAERGGCPVRAEVALQVLARGRGLAAGEALAPLLGERLEGRVGGRPEGERRRRPVRLRDPVDVGEGVLEPAGLVGGERRVARSRAAAARRRAGWRRRRRRARAVRNVSGSRPAARAWSAVIAALRPTSASRASKASRAAAASGSVAAVASRSPTSSRGPQAQREAALARGGQRHDAAGGGEGGLETGIGVVGGATSSSAAGASAATRPPRRLIGLRHGGAVDPDELRARPRRAAPPTNRDGAFSPPTPCVVRISRSWARVIATYSSRRSSSVWRSPARDLLAQELAREPAAGLLADRPLPVEQVRDDDDRELQALRLVQGHEPDAVDVLGQLDAGRQLAARGLVGVEVVDEVRERTWPGSRPASRTRSA